MSILTGLQRLFSGAVLANGSSVPISETVNYRIQPRELPAAAIYGLLKTLYLSTGAYDDLSRANVVLGRQTPQMKSIRNPIAPVVEAWGAKLWPEPLTIVTENPAITKLLELVWRWSNWRASRPKVARWTALYGEGWLKVQADQDLGRVWFEYLEPTYITDFEEDARGYVQYVRVDIPKTEDTDAGIRHLTHTEVWSTTEQEYRRWETEGDACARKLTDLGTPLEVESFGAFGIDFCPFVRIPFADVGEKRGIGAVQVALEAIFEADLSATNLHSMLYVDGDGAWVATAAGTDAAGRPVPALRIAAAEPAYDVLGRQNGNGTGAQSDGSISVGKRSFWRLPAGYDLKSVVANIDYTAALAILQDHDEHMERLIPALAYARLADMGGPELSGRALRYKLTAFIDQVIGVRATALEKLGQADAMALTLGKANGIAGFEGVGDFDAGDFEHGFETVDVIPISDFEAAQTEQLDAQAYAAWTGSGLPEIEALQRAGYSKIDAARIVRVMTRDAEAAVQRQQEIFGQQQQQGDTQGGQGV